MEQKPLSRFEKLVEYIVFPVLMISATVIPNRHKFFSADPTPVQTNERPQSAPTNAVEHLNIRMPNAMVMVGIRDAEDPALNQAIGSGVLLKKRIIDSVHTLFVTARHVAYGGAALGGKRELIIKAGNGITRLPVNDDPWLIDAEKDDELAVLDVSYMGIESYAIDLDDDSNFKALKSSQFEEYGIRHRTKVFAACGVTKDLTFVAKSGWYLNKSEGYHLLYLDAQPGNSGSPVFAYENGKVYFIGLLSFGNRGKETFAGVAPLDNLFWLIEHGGEAYFIAKEKKATDDLDYKKAGELMLRKGITSLPRFSRSKICILPTEMTVNGVRYTIERTQPQGKRFVIRGPSGKVVNDGTYIVCTSPVTAFYSAFAYACTNAKLSLDELDSRVKCEWLDEEKTTLKLIGVSKARYIVSDDVVLALRKPDPPGVDISLTLFKMMLMRP